MFTFIDQDPGSNLQYDIALRRQKYSIVKTIKDLIVVLVVIQIAIPCDSGYNNDDMEF